MDKRRSRINIWSNEVKSSNAPLPRITKSSTVFATENIRIELKENYDKELLKKIVEVLINAN